MAMVWLVVRLLQKSFMHGRSEGWERDDEPNSDVYGVLLISARPGHSITCGCSSDLFFQNCYKSTASS